MQLALHLQQLHPRWFPCSPTSICAQSLCCPLFQMKCSVSCNTVNIMTYKGCCSSSVPPVSTLTTRMVPGLTCDYKMQGNASASATAVSQALSQGASAPTIGQAVGQVVRQCLPCSLSCTLLLPWLALQTGSPVPVDQVCASDPYPLCSMQSC